MDTHKNGGLYLVLVNVYLFLWCLFIKNCQKWVYTGMGEIFLLGIKKFGPKR